jgi:hypothetical protein
MAGNRKVSTFKLTVQGRRFEVFRIEYPFREGVELEVEIDGERLRFSDRQLGEREARRLLEAELERRINRSG